MGRLLADVTQPNVLSRYINLAVAIEALLDSGIHQDKKLLEGTLLGKMGSGNYRAYFEAETSVAFSTGNANFTLSEISGQALMKHLRVGDVIEGTDGTALGTVATFDASTGVGTLTANSANNHSTNVRVQPADLSIAAANRLVLKDENAVGSDDLPVAAYYEGFFNTAMVLGATPAALTAMSAKVVSSSEFRLI